MSRPAKTEKDSYERKDLEMTAKAKQKESGSLSSRDLIALGVFSLLFMVVIMQSSRLLFQ